MSHPAGPMDRTAAPMALGRLIEPRAIALIGASPDATKLAGRPLGYLQRYGFKGTVYGVNPKHKEVQGIRCFADVESLPDGIDLALILFDPRPDSPTRGEVCRIVLSEHDRCLVNVPEDVWHADHNIGTRDVLVVNHPTIQFDHAAPDKWRLPLDTPLIPYRFPPGTQGW